ncbi:single-stranded-DNA-specific exonuclease RecJ [Lacticaseibacillus hegangensis]|uniref:Single-stranded-DNA-specific exonuclease RecJ n=1 Tax=Lacticaseibacillus hegangensis TaxID=2486010 RepID=A0ABW4CVJ9_9LACO|nr:single-stranded-DNA-specific exonuclease RecJ [Lacticaseibacillus hegangensis]
MAHYLWQEAAQPSSDQIQQVAEALSVPPFLARLLIQRGITNQAAYEAFCTPDLSRLHDPFALHDMQKAVDRIKLAITRQEKITIYGDYDVDGLTATSIMKDTLENSLGADNVETFIPDRFTDGYGPNQAVYDYLRKNGTELVVTVDNGVGGAAVIDQAMAAGMDVVVTDHHELPKVLPKAVAVVHPRHPDGHYPFNDLSGAGVAFKVASALLGEPATDCLDLAALGTVADIVSMTGENRLIVQMGLQLIHQQQRPGINALIKVADLDPAKVDETAIGFGIGPRLNALGRLGDANPGVTLLTTFDDDEAEKLAENVNTLNQKRQALVAKIVQEAMAIAESPENQAQKTLIIAHAGWHEGVLGIVASHIVEATGKPTLVLNIAKDGQTAKGSGRSVPAYNLFKALDAARDEMTHFGGHAMAAGLTVPVANIPALHAAMEQAAAVELKGAEKPPLTISGRLTAADISLDHYHLMRKLAPFGPGNEEPTFAYVPQQVGDIQQMGKTNAHLRFTADGQKVVAFNRGADAPALAAASQVKLALRMDENTWQNRTSLQLRLVDWELKQPNVIDMRLPQASAEQFRGAYNYVFFDAKRKQAMTSAFMFGGPVVMADAVTNPLANAVLVDLPPDEASLRKLLAHIALPVRVVFTAPAAELVAVPNRQEFGSVLHFLAAHPGFDKHQLGFAAKQVHLTIRQVILAVQVFFELGFVRIDGSQITVTAHPEKKALQESSAYQRQSAFLQLAHRLQTAARPALEDWLTAQK